MAPSAYDSPRGQSTGTLCQGTDRALTAERDDLLKNCCLMGLSKVHLQPEGAGAFTKMGCLDRGGGGGGVWVILTALSQGVLTHGLAQDASAGREGYQVGVLGQGVLHHLDSLVPGVLTDPEKEASDSGE